MLSLLRGALVASVVGSLTVLGIVATAGSAAATPRDELLQLYGVVPVESDGEVHQTYTADQAYAAIQAMCAYDPNACPQEVALTIPFGPGGGTGTAAAVKAGQSWLAKTCATAKQCGVLASGVVLGLLGIGQEAADWLPDDSGSPDLSDAPVVYYASSRAKSWVLNNTVTSALSINSGDSITWSGQGIANVSGWTGNFSVRYYVAADWVVKSTGQWVHQSSTLVGATWTTGQTKSVTFDPTSGAAAADIELRRLHIVEDGTVGATQTEANLQRGWRWGQEIIDPLSQMRSRTGCLRPDGTEYTVESAAVEATVGGANIAACNAGDTPIWNELLKCDPAAANCTSQSVISLRPRTAPPTFAPDCATAGCRWFVKIDGTPCAVGDQFCVDWTRHKERATCWFGPYQMPLENCYWLERAYETRGPVEIPASTPNVDGDPDTHEGPAPAPYVPPSPTPSPTATVTASPSPSTTTSPGPNPSSSPSPSPSSSPSASASPSPSASASPSPSASNTPTPTPSPTPPRPPENPACVTDYNLGPVQTEAVALANYIGPNYQIPTIYGYRDPGSDWAGEHSSGLALDFMLTHVGESAWHAQGQAIADYLQANAARWGVHWIIWEQHVWNVERADEGWRLMEDRGSATENHMDHVHVYLYDLDPDGVTCSSPDDPGGAGGGCLSRAVSWNPVDWVYWPTRCVLEWAFVPPGGSAFFDGQVDTLGAEFRDSPVGQWWGLIGDVGTGVESLEGGGTDFNTLRLDNADEYDGTAYDGGSTARAAEIEAATAEQGYRVQTGAIPCQGPELSMDFLGDYVNVPDAIYPFDACDGAMATVAATSRIIITATIVWSIFWVTLRQIGAAFSLAIPETSGTGSQYGSDDVGPDRRRT